MVLILGFLAQAWLAGAQPRYVPTGTNEPQAFYYPNAFADPVTGEKTGWSVAGSSVEPVYGMWQNQEHAILRAGTNRWLVVAMETNRKYFMPPSVAFVEAYKFLEYDDGILDGATTPTFQAGYWRGNTMESHNYVWAPYVIEDGGTYYLFYTASDPDTPNWLACYLATSTTGSADPADWTQYDPNPGTTTIEPLFQGTDSSIKDFHVIRVETSEGPRFYCYYIANPTVPDPENPTESVTIADVRLRISADLLDWTAAEELLVFRRINVGVTNPASYATDYENPEIIQYDDGSFYLFVSRHGQVPADYQTNPDWEPIPLATEVYWSADGLEFRVEHQLPNLTSATGRELNAAEIVRDGDRWFATHAQPSNNPDNYELDEPWDNPVQHSDLLLKLVTSFAEPEFSLQILEFDWARITAAQCWVLYP
jgi:hypothetical protein